jgi:hypothetical protein
MTAICDWGSRGDLEVFFGQDIIVDETVCGSVNMSGGYSSYLFVAIYLLSPGDVMDRGMRAASYARSSWDPSGKKVSSEPHSELANGVGIWGRAVTLSFAGRFFDHGATAGVSESGANETQPTAISTVQ